MQYNRVYAYDCAKLTCTVEMAGRCLVLRMNERLKIRFREAEKACIGIYTSGNRFVAYIRPNL